MTTIFNKMAKKYDTPERKSLAKIIEKHIAHHLQDAADKILIDYGGGTGLVSLPLAPLVKKLGIVDASPAMVEVAQQKIKKNAQKNARAEVGDLLSDSPLSLHGDIFLLSLVLLHIPDTQRILEKIHQSLSDNGSLIIVDFIKNPKVQHPLIHNGFERQELTTALNQAGFTVSSFSVFHEGKQLFAGQDAALFLCCAQKTALT